MLSHTKIVRHLLSDRWEERVGYLRPYHTKILTSGSVQRPYEASGTTYDAGISQIQPHIPGSIDPWPELESPYALEYDHGCCHRCLEFVSIRFKTA